MDISRRNFNFSVAGFFGALFAPKGSQAAIPGPEAIPTTAKFNDHDHNPAGNTTLIGHVSSQPTFKSCIKEDGSIGTRAFFRVACDGKFIPVVAWDKRAAWCRDHLQPGFSIMLLGSTVATGKDSYHIEMHRAETPNPPARY